MNSGMLIICVEILTIIAFAQRIDIEDLRKQLRKLQSELRQHVHAELDDGK